MIGHDRYKYGHTKTRCRRKGACQNCGQDDYISHKANKCSNESKCTNCGEGHEAGSIECERKKEKKRVI